MGTYTGTTELCAPHRKILPSLRTLMLGNKKSPAVSGLHEHVTTWYRAGGRCRRWGVLSCSNLSPKPHFSPYLCSTILGVLNG